jgi:hypothetical protein
MKNMGEHWKSPVVKEIVGGHGNHWWSRKLLVVMEITGDHGNYWWS